MNSTCPFCNLTKFVVDDDNGTYKLKRCDVPSCEKHCRSNHPPVETTLQIADRDSVAIVSGW